jgi:predicted nucleic acid-binding protein
MKLIIGGTAIFELLKKESLAAKVFFNKNIQLYAPEVLIKDIENYTEIIKTKTGRSAFEFEKFMSLLRKRIRKVRLQNFKHYISSAQQITTHEDEQIYFALAMHLKCPVWTNDLQMKGQRHILAYTTQEVLGLVQKESNKIL